MQNTEKVFVHIPNVKALQDIVKTAQLDNGQDVVPFSFIKDGGTMSLMSAPGTLKQVDIGWDGVMFKVVDSERVSFHDDLTIHQAVPIGKPGFIPLM